MSDLSHPHPLTQQDQQAKNALIRFMRALRRDWWLLGAIVVVVTGLAIVLTRLQTPLYQSSTSILFNERNGGLGLSVRPDAARPESGSGLETDIAVIASRQVAATAVDILKMNVAVENPEISAAQIFRRVETISEVQPAAYELVRSGNGYSLRNAPGATVLQQVTPDVPVPLGGVTVTFSEGLTRLDAERIPFQVLDSWGVADGLRGSVVIGRAAGPARVLTITYRSPEPTLAAAVPNAFADAFIDRKTGTALSEGRSRIDFLQEQVTAYELQMAEAEDRLRSFRERDRVVNLDIEAEEQVNRLSQLRSRHDEIQGELNALNRLLAEVEQGSADAVISPYRQLASFPYLFSNGVVRDILTTLTELENRRSELMIRREPANLDVLSLGQRIGELEQQLYRMAMNYRTSLNSQVISIQDGIDRLQQELEVIPSRELQYARLEREREQLAAMYSILQQRLKESEIENAAHPQVVEILDPALVPSFPVAPRPTVNLMLGLIASLMLGASVVFVRSRLDTTLWGPEDAREATQGLPIMAQIPRIESHPAEQLALVGGNGRRFPVPVRLQQNGASRLLAGERMVMLSDLESPGAEAYRRLRDSLLGASNGEGFRTLVVTSVLPGEGKSTTAANLAVAFAEQEARTLLIDTDFRGGRVHRLFGMGPGLGLRELLDGTVAAEDVVEHPSGAGAPRSLYILRAGSADSASTPYRGLPRISEHLSRLSNEFDVIIMDAAPIGLFTDARVLASDADGVLLVARVGTTQRKALESAVQEIANFPTRVRGLALNDVPSPHGAGRAYAEYQRAITVD